MPFYASLREAVLDVLFPPTCFGCGSDAWLCPVCAATMAFDRQDNISTDGLRCISLGAYAQPLLRNLVYQLKYGSASCLLPDVERLMQTWRDGRREPWPWATWQDIAIVPMPADPTRLRARGFDHVAALAQAFQRTILPWGSVQYVLKKARRVSPNADLPADRLREANVKGAFALVGAAPERVILVDDVLTTGATVSEAARTLREAGTKEVVVFTLARG